MHKRASCGTKYNKLRSHQDWVYRKTAEYRAYDQTHHKRQSIDQTHRNCQANGPLAGPYIYQLLIICIYFFGTAGSVLLGHSL